MPEKDKGEYLTLKEYSESRNIPLRYLYQWKEAGMPCDTKSAATFVWSNEADAWRAANIIEEPRKAYRIKSA